MDLACKGDGSKVAAPRGLRGTARGGVARPRRRVLSLATLWADESAAAAVEFSLVSLPVIGLLLASLQLSLIFFAGQMLQSAATNAGREIMTGQAQKNGMSATQFGQAVCSSVSTFFNCGAMMVDVEAANTFSSVSTAAPTITYDSHGNVTNQWSWSPGAPGQIVVVKVLYNWPVFGPALLGLSNQPNGGHLLMAVTVFKNEPFPSS
jgi:Flp pilus assembly protein TadG